MTNSKRKRLSLVLAVALLLTLVPGFTAQKASAATVIKAIQDGSWTNSSTWDLGRVPAAGDDVVIPDGRKVTYDANSTANIHSVTVKGTLTFSTSKKTNLNVGLLKIGASATDGTLACDGSHHPTAAQPGALVVGSPGAPIPRTYPASIQLVKFADHADEDLPAIVNCGGKWEMAGAPIQNPWVELSSGGTKDSASITVTGDVSDWKIGDEIIIVAARNNKSSFGDNPPSYRTSTSHVPETEVRTISAISSNTITLNAKLQYDHSSRGSNTTEVANLTRSVIVKSQGTSSDAIRGHTMYHKHSSGSISYARFDGLGKEGLLGRYPVHIHMAEDTMRGFQLLGSAITNSHNKFVALHRSHYLVVRDNVGYNGVASGFFLEDGTETYNVLDRNLSVLTMNGTAAPNEVVSYTDGKGHGYWWINPRNTFINNVAAENDDFGFFLELDKVSRYYDTTYSSPVFLDAPMLMEDGTTATTRINKAAPFRFANNEAHAEHKWAFQFTGGLWTLNRPFIAQNSKVWSTHYMITADADGLLIDGIEGLNLNYGLDVKQNYEGGKKQADHITFRNAVVDGAGVAALALGGAGGNVNLVNTTLRNSTRVVWLPNSGYDVAPRIVFENLSEDYSEGFVFPRDYAKTNGKTPVLWFNDRYGSNSAAKVIPQDRVGTIGDGLTYGSDAALTRTTSSTTDIEAIRAVTTDFTGYTVPALVDDMKPATAITSFGGGMGVRKVKLTSDGKLTLEGTTTDNGIVSNVKVNGVSVTKMASDYSRWKVTLSGLSAGSYTIEARGYDAAGNVEANPHRIMLELYY